MASTTDLDDDPHIFFFFFRVCFFDKSSGFETWSGSLIYLLTLGTSPSPGAYCLGPDHPGCVLFVRPDREPAVGPGRDLTSHDFGRTPASLFAVPPVHVPPSGDLS